MNGEYPTSIVINREFIGAQTLLHLDGRLGIALSRESVVEQWF